MSVKSKWIYLVAQIAMGLVMTWGVLAAFQRGGSDFNVFYTAWKHVWSGHAELIYQKSPDRYLYAPGFAWLLAPMALFSYKTGLAIWSLGKAVLLAMMLRVTATALHRREIPGNGVAAIAFLFITRPLLIDVQYGQINGFLLAVSVITLLMRYRSGGGHWLDGFRWSVLAALAVTKLYLIPLLAVPFLVTSGLDRKRLRLERVGIVLGLFVIVFIPVLTEGFSGAFSFYEEWKVALEARGMPRDGHNQSFAGLLQKLFSGQQWESLAYGARYIKMGWSVFSQEQIKAMTLGWLLISMGFLGGWIMSAKKHSPLIFVSVLIALLIVPSHLVWKPYFIFSFPVAALALRDAISQYHAGKKSLLIIFAILFALINLTSISFLPMYWAVVIEAICTFLFVHLALIFLVVRGENQAIIKA